MSDIGITANGSVVYALNKEDAKRRAKELAKKSINRTTTVKSPTVELRERLELCEYLLAEAYWVTRTKMKLGDDAQLNKDIDKYFQKYGKEDEG